MVIMGTLDYNGAFNYVGLVFVLGVDLQMSGVTCELESPIRVGQPTL